MGFELREVDPTTDFPAIARCMFDSYEDPLQTFFYAFFPIHGDTHDAREEAIAECATRLHSWHTEDPTSYWQKIVDTDTGRIAGGALWNIHKENPFANEHHMEVTWFPDDGSRRFAEQVVEIHAAPRIRVGQRPQVYLFIIFTHPDYRRKGVGQMFMNWGMAKADEMGVELFLDATPVGRPLYKANGLIEVEEHIIVPRMDHPDDAWKASEKKIGHSTWFLMWRPPGGNYEEGKTIKPWERK
ncbi:acyl-CoA N-acyltransferase [Xylaria scruposa]|nr:acyl-CoA N-acyltransferase [Xylaria scruposa]